MQTGHFVKAAIFTAILVVGFIIIWEIYWREKGYVITYDDGKELWADKRAMVYKPINTATVFIGSSRIKYDLDISTWEKLTGEKAVQLAMEGNSPVPILKDLAGDEKFKGKLVIDVTEGLFFSPSPNDNTDPAEYAKYFKEITPTQKMSFILNHGLESKFVFLNKDYLSLNGLLLQQKLPVRKDVFLFPGFPKEFSHVTFDRQNIIEAAFLTDTALQNWVTGNWKFFSELRKKAPPVRPGQVDTIFREVKQATDQITRRGGQVMFVRTPSSGPFWEREQIGFPRDKFWGKLLSLTGLPGIHFKDYKETSDYICPEWSHLSHPDAIDYTRHLVRQLEEKGWSFPNKSQDNSLATISKL